MPFCLIWQAGCIPKNSKYNGVPMNGKYAGSGNGTHPNGSPHLHNHLQTGRIISFIVVIALVFLVYVVRLFNLQILNAELYVARAQENSTSEVNTPAPRGIITDRNGVV